MSGARRVRKYILSPWSLLHIFLEGTSWKVDPGIPEGSQYRGIAIDPHNDQINLWVEHDSFELVKDGEEYPPFYVSVTRLGK